MLRNILAATLRNLMRQKLYAAVTLIGLAAGFAAALLIALIVHDDLSYDRWLPLHERTYLLRAQVDINGTFSHEHDLSPAEYAAPLKLDFPQIETVARFEKLDFGVRHGPVEAIETVHWADPNFFDLLRLPAFAGDLATALEAPESVVLTRSMARKYFGRDNAIGETLEFGRSQTMKVTAILEDLPSNSHISLGIVASGRAATSALTYRDTHPRRDFLVCCATYVRLKPGASPRDVNRALPAFVARHTPAAVDANFRPRPMLTPLAAIHLAPPSLSAFRPRAQSESLMAAAAIGVLILLTALTNFAGLMTVRGAQRAREMSVRKATGAGRRDLLLQFAAENLVYGVLAMLVALAAVEVALPRINGFLDRTIAFDWWRSPSHAAVLAMAMLGLGALAAFFPAILLTTMQRAGRKRSAVQATLRSSLILLQFAVLTGLLIATVVVHRQVQFAMNGALRVDPENVYLISYGCRNAFKNEVRNVAGVRGAACSSGLALKIGNFTDAVRLADGTVLNAAQHAVDLGFFELYGLEPAAGRFFREDHPGDAVPEDRSARMAAPVVLNETAARRFGFSGAADAVGRTIVLEGYENPAPSEIIGIVPDFSMDPIGAEIPPVVYLLNPPASTHIAIKLTGEDIAGTLQRVAAVWERSARYGPPDARFLEQHIFAFVRDVKQRETMFAWFSALAVLVSTAGLFGLAAHTAVRRTKEIGIRKATGARTGDVLRLLNWEFAKPVLIANLIAWPVAYWLMHRWLEGFAYHIELELWMFAAAGGAALAIALATVSFHSWMVARAKPVTALRHE